MKELKVFIKKTCKTCQKFVNAAKKAGYSVETIEFVDYNVLDEAKLRDLLKRAGVRPADVLRKRDRHFKELGLDKKLPPDDELIRLMVKHPGLIQRPIVVAGKGVWFRPKPEQVLEEGHS